MKYSYLLDANIFITAHRQRYPFDIVPSFWKQLIDRAADQVMIIEKVEEELLRGKDELTEWYEEQSAHFTVLNIPTQEVIASYRQIINFVNESEQYTPSAKEEFASIADSWLCAYALASNATIVTLEVYQQAAKRRIKIPNVCENFNVRYIDLLKFMREVSMRF